MKIGRFRFRDSGSILCAGDRGRSKDGELTPMQRFTRASNARHSRDGEAEFISELNEDGEQPEVEEGIMARQHAGQLSLAAKMQRFKSTSDARHGLNKSPKGRGGRR